MRAGCELQYIKSKMDDDLYKLEEASKGIEKEINIQSQKRMDQNFYMIYLNLLIMVHLNI